MENRRFHFIYLYGPTTRDFDINHRISIASNIEVNKPSKVRIFTNDVTRLTHSKHMMALLNSYDNIMIVDVKTVYNTVKRLIGLDLNKLPHMAHVADMCRLSIMYQYGGVYSDVDSIALKPLPITVWNSHKPVFCYEYPNESGEHTAICNGFFFSPKGDQFISDWLMNWKSYDPNDCMPGTPNWGKYSTQMAWKLYSQDRSRITIYDSRYLEPFTLRYKDIQDMYFLTNFDKLKDSYQMHLWETRSRDIIKVLDENYFKYSNATYAQIGRKYL